MAILKIAEGSEVMANFVGEPGSNGNLHPFAPLKNQSPKGTVKVIQIPDLLKGGARLELVGVPWNCKRKAISGNSVVV